MASETSPASVQARHFIAFAICAWIAIYAMFALNLQRAAIGVLAGLVSAAIMVPVVADSTYRAKTRNWSRFKRLAMMVGRAIAGMAAIVLCLYAVALISFPGLYYSV